eukprot:3352680-Amphidinium_carterae.1
MDTLMNEDYIEEEHNGKHIIIDFFTKTRLNDKQPGHRLWINNKNRQNPPDLDNADLPSIDNTTKPDNIQPPPAAKPDAYKPTQRLTGKQPPAIVAQRDDISLKKEITLENNEDKEKIRMETIMKDTQVQPWWQYEDDNTMFSELAVKDAMKALHNQK